MLISLDQMYKIHEIQLEIFKEIERVMNELDVNYFFIHGSLLGALRDNNFIDEDDDIDIALFRDDYNKLLKEGNSIISSKYFIQSSLNDDFPLAFAKVRRYKTSFIQPVLADYDCNNGIYIDVFPIDYDFGDKSIFFELQNTILNIRINKRLKGQKKFKRKIVELFSLILYPSYNNALCKRERLYSSIKDTKYVSIFGGKASERRMQFNWFGEGKKHKFCDIEVNCPCDADAYLSRIYGSNYLNHNPAQLRISSDKKIEVSASMIDFDES